MKKGRNVISEMLIPIGFALGIVIYLTLHLGLKYGLKAALVSASVFTVICGGLCFLSFFLCSAKTKYKKKGVTESEIIDSRK